ncbi:MAG: AAA family ATPase [Gammaproteobacteria bacterium]|nr:AAA family ATPase [Gammaproteobacteria bacterium]
MSSSPAVFVGRGRELAVFAEAFDQMLEGRRQILTLAGEPGIGKTRLAEAFADAAEDRGALALWGRCFEEPGAPPYWPWVQILREIVEAMSPSELSLLAGPDGSEIAALVPELGIAIGMADGRDDAPVEPSRARFRTFNAICGFLKRVTAQVPLVLLVDNLHWADKASLTVLELLSQALVQSRIMIVCTYRDTELSRTDPLPATLGVLGSGDGVARLRLQGLGQEAITVLADGMLGKALSARVVRAIDQQTDGNPLFVIELLKVLLEESRDAGIEPITVRIPDGVRETIGRRLSRLPDHVNGMLRTASVIGRDFDAAVLARIAVVDVEGVLAALHLAEEAGFVSNTDRAAQAYRFTHALIRETLYDELPTPERLQLHALAGDALAAVDADRTQSRLSRIAHHYFESSALGNAEQAVDFAARAAHEAMRLDAYDEAALHFGNVVRLLRQSPRRRPERLREAIYWQTRALTGTADFGAAAALITEALDDHELASDEAWLTDVGTQWIVLTSHSMQAEQLPLLRRLLQRLPQGDSAARAKALAAQAFAERTLGGVHGVKALIDESMAMARRLGDPAVLSHCLRSSLLALAGDPTQIDTRLALAEEYIGVAPPGDSCERMAEALYHQACNLIEAGKFDGVDRVVDSFERLNATKFGFQEYRARALPVVLSLARGEYDGLSAKIETLREIGQKTRGEDADGVYGVQMFMLNRDLGRLRALAPLIERFAASPLNRAWTPGLMLALTEIGRLDDAARELDKLAAGEFAMIPFDALRTSTLVYCAETCTALGDAERAKVLYPLLVPYAGTFATHHLAVCFGSTDQYLGMLAATMGDLDRARRHFDAAVRAHAAARAWPWLARTCQRYALALRKSQEPNDRARAEQLLREAEQLADRLGMQGLGVEIDALLRGDRAQASYPVGLTAREVEVLQLLVIGRSNKDISKVLSISLNTVATHVRNILTKTECANRTEAAAYAHRNGLAGSA